MNGLYHSIITYLNIGFDFEAVRHPNCGISSNGSGGWLGIDIIKKQSFLQSALHVPSVTNQMKGEGCMQTSNHYHSSYSHIFMFQAPETTVQAVVSGKSERQLIKTG